MNKRLKNIIQGILFVLILGGFIFIGTRDFSKKVVVDNEKFDLEYSNVSGDNVFKYSSSQDVYQKFKNGNAVIFMGFASNKWSGPYANMVNEAAKSVGLKEVLYYDFYKDREEKNATYQSIVLKLANYAPIMDKGVQNIYAPTLVIIKKGQVVFYDDDSAISRGNISVKDYWNEFRTSEKINYFKLAFQDYLKDEAGNGRS